MANLIIVESPSKAKTLKNYLGAGYNIVASKGHIRDLPAARLSVDVKNDFAPKYSTRPGDIAVVTVEDETTLKRYYPEAQHRRIRLHPENETMQDIFVTECAVQGIAVKVIHDL